MTELEKIAYAKTFIDKLANGINPLDDQPVAEYDIVNNVRLSRCFFYVSDILRQVIENGGTYSQKRKTKISFSVTPQQLKEFQYSDVPLSITEIVGRINQLIDTDKNKKLLTKQVTNWLLSIDVLFEQVVDTTGKARKFPTAKGIELGVFCEQRDGHYGKYTAVLYNKDAQKFIIDNMEAIISL